MADTWQNQQMLENLVRDTLQEAKKAGADSAEVNISLSKGFNVTARKGEVESVEYNQDRSLDITVYSKQKLGSVSLSDFRPEAIRSAVSAACSIARFVDRDDCAGLAEKQELATYFPDLDLYHPWKITVDEAVDLAIHCEKIAFAVDKRIKNSEGASVATTDGCHVYGNSHGFLAATSSSRHEISCSLIAVKGKEMQQDFHYTVSCDSTLLDSIDQVAEIAAKRAVNRLGARSLSTRRAPVIFAAEQARGLLGHFLSAISGGNLYRKSSFLLDRLGTQVFPTHITLDERPYLPKSPGSAAFDNDGVATRPNKFIQNGILQSYLLGVYSARKLKMKTTGNAGGVHNLFINTGEKDLAALLKTMHTGLLVTDLMGQGVNMVTGDYSRGATGFWIENGEIQYPVQEITIAGNLNDMFASIIEVGCDIDKRGNVQTGSILLDHMIIAGD